MMLVIAVETTVCSSAVTVIASSRASVISPRLDRAASASLRSLADKPARTDPPPTSPVPSRNPPARRPSTAATRSLPDRVQGRSTAPTFGRGPSAGRSVPGQASRAEARRAQSS